MPQGNVIETSQFGKSTVSLILRSDGVRNAQ
jgi:hypothetical protein